MKQIAIIAALMAVGCGTTEPTPNGGSGGEGGVSASAGGVGGEGGEGGEGGAPAAVCGPWASEVVSVSYGPGQEHGRDLMPGIVLGPPVGGGLEEGSLDVVSLGNGGEIVLGFGDGAIVDGPGVDFVVFENPFEVGNTELIFAELGTVAVSDDGIEWASFGCEATMPPYGSCAGHTPVTMTGDGPLDPAESGGDAFDLADLGIDSARFVRVTDREDLMGPTGVFDLDAVGIVNLQCP